MIVALVLLALAGPVLAADPPRLPDGITCDHVRAEYARWSFVGKIAIKVYLRKVEQYSQQQVEAAERCITSRR